MQHIAFAAPGHDICFVLQEGIQEQPDFPDWRNHRKTEQFVSAVVGSARLRPSHKSARSSLKYGNVEIFGFGHIEASKNRE